MATQGSLHKKLVTDGVPKASGLVNSLGGGMPGEALEALPSSPYLPYAALPFGYSGVVSFYNKPVI